MPWKFWIRRKQFLNPANSKPMVDLSANGLNRISDLSSGWLTMFSVSISPGFGSNLAFSYIHKVEMKQLNLYLLFSVLHQFSSKPCSRRTSVEWKVKVKNKIYAILVIHTCFFLFLLSLKQARFMPINNAERPGEIGKKYPPVRSELIQIQISPRYNMNTSVA